MATNSIVTDNNDLEIFTLVWLDATVNDEDNQKIHDNLSKLTNQLKTFDDTDEFESYLQTSTNDERIVLIVSGRFGRDIVPRIHQIEQIYSIYVYCFDRESNEKWAKDYSKIKAVLTKSKELIQKVRNDNRIEIIPVSNDLLYLNIYTNNQFIHSQLLINHLIQMKIYSTINSELFDLCKNEYPQENLDDFQENYSADNCLSRLIKDQFISKLISQSLERKNIDLLCLTRFYLRDIYQQLQAHQYSRKVHVYHSHLIAQEDIEQLKNSVEKLISINTFFLTTSYRQQALVALNQCNNESEKILFEIDADPTIEGIKPFANITSFSDTKQPGQIMFMLGSIFRIKNLFQENNIWICQMDLSSENDQEIKHLFEEIHEEDGDSSKDILAFGNLLARINEYDAAEKYYQYILKNYPTNPSTTSICYQNLGNVFYIKNDYDQSLGYHLKCLEIQERSLKSNHQNLAETYNTIGIIYLHKNDYKQAINYYEKGLKILQLKSNENCSKIIICLNNLAHVYRLQEDYLKSFECYKKILDIQKQYHIEENSDFGQIYHNIGANYWCRGYNHKAMQYYQSALENKNKYLSTKDPSIAMTLENIGLFHENNNDYQQAYKYYKDAENIYKQTLDMTHEDLIQIQENILRVSNCF